MNAAFAQQYKYTKNSIVSMFNTALLLLAIVLPVFMHGQASAAQLTSRSATLDNSKVSATGVSIAFAYTLPTTGSSLQGIVYNFCTTPLGTCTLPTGMTANAATHTSQSGFPTNATAFAVRTGADLGACLSTSGTTYTRCFLRTQAATGGGAVTHVMGNITAPSAKQTVYIRISLYSDVSYGTLVDSGTVAVAFVDQLTTTGRVQERLNFCVAAITNAASEPANVAACSALGTSTIDIGIIDNSTFAISPVPVTATNGSNNRYGILMSDTNGSGGLAISYYPEAASSGTNQLRNFRVTGATCNASNANLTDQCFRETAGGATGTTVTVNNEWFGMNIACIFQGGTTTALTIPGGAAGYNGDGVITSSTTCEDPSAGDTSKKFGWDSSGTALTIASSTAVVDNEIVKIRFGATAGATTPTGAYTVVTTFVATPTF